MEISRSIFFISVLALAISSQQTRNNSTLSKARNWALKFRAELMSTEDYVTRIATVNSSFQGTQVVKRDDRELAKEIATEIKNMMNLKISAVKRIVDTAENRAQSFKDEEIDYNFGYYNAKCLNATDEPCTNETKMADLVNNPHFWDLEVNTSFSAVHVPTNVYDRAQEVLRAIMWSKQLDDIFISNFQQDPSLSWQYFGSSTGFMRQYPAMQWKQQPVDLYDCRMRSWFIEGATSPKDMVILVDNSGSMTGIRKEIARHVVNNILDTLGNNDYVNILKFGENTSEIVPCFKDLLVQANLANIRAFKQSMENMTTINIANFTLALYKAFDLLEKYRNDSDEYSGARCNQAIMLITDGVPYNFAEIFKRFNWPHKTVRVFTYLVGREVADVRDIQWMACANRGYYVHLSTLAEVREQVLQYIPVMARPLVLNGNRNVTDRPTVWSPVYADITDPKMTDWLWEEKEKKVQKKIFMDFRKDKAKFRSDEELKKRTYENFKRGDQWGDMSEYKLMTSVSMPVFDRRENANITERVLLNEAFWVERLRETRIANLLGVAGTDIPISEIQKLMNPFKLGVNAYAFVVTNNGYVICHPDLRAVFQGILKPNYNSVDMAEVELVDDDRGPREFDSIIDFRTDVLNQRPGVNITLHTKYHYDGMRRVGLIKRDYYTYPIENSPFSVVVTVPGDRHRKFHTRGQIEVHREVPEGIAEGNKNRTMNYFRGNWVVHPDWIYCKYYNDSHNPHKNPEEEFLYFLGRTQAPGWKWTTKDLIQPPEATHHRPTISNSTSGKSDKDLYYCDRDLFLSLVYDAEATQWFNEDIHSQDSAKKFEVTVAFVATRSGLTRWKDIEERGDKPSFGELHNKAIDELWYKRSVEFNYVQNGFMYSVPLGVGSSKGTLVTVTQTVFATQMGNRAPVAVVGYQFHHTALSTWFFNVTSACSTSADCEKTCASDTLDCFVLDNSGYIIVSENTVLTGKFFGEIYGAVLRSMIMENIYKKVTVYDYQAVCFENTEMESSGNMPFTPWNVMLWLWKWLLVHTLWLLTELSLGHADLVTPHAYYTSDYEGTEDPPLMVHDTSDDSDSPRGPDRLETDYILNRTRPQACDQEVDLYYLVHPKNKNYTLDATANRPYVVQAIDSTNLILVVVDTLFLNKEEVISNIPKEVDYYNESLTCYKVFSNNLPRKRPKECISRHTEEEQIELCGRSHTVLFSWALLLFNAVFALTMSVDLV